MSDASSPLLCDLGLGDERWSKVRPTHAYRGARDASVVLRGSVDDARHAIRETTTRGRGALLLVFATTAFIALSAAGAMLFTHRRPWVSLSEVNLAQAPFPSGNLHVVWAARWPPVPGSRAASVEVSDAPLSTRAPKRSESGGAAPGRQAQSFLKSFPARGSRPRSATDCAHTQSGCGDETFVLVDSTAAAAPPIPKLELVRLAEKGLPSAGVAQAPTATQVAQ